MHVILALGLNYKSAEVAVLKHSIKYYLIPAVVMQTIKYIQRDLSINSMHTNQNEHIMWSGIAKEVFLGI
jgi:uncharacterized membrane-anchored protein